MRTTVGARTTRHGEGTSREPSRSRAHGSPASTTPSSSASLVEERRRRSRRRPLRLRRRRPCGREQARRPRAHWRPRLRGRLGRVGSGRRPARRAASELRAARPRRVALAGARWPDDGGRAGGALPPLPRQLRSPRRVRGRPSPRRAASRHERAREPRRLAAPVSGGAGRRPAARSESHTTPP